MKSENKVKVSVIRCFQYKKQFIVWRISKRRTWIWVGVLLTPTQIAHSALLVCTSEEILFLAGLSEGEGI